MTSRAAHRKACSAIVGLCALSNCGPTGSRWATQSANQRLAEERRIDPPIPTARSQTAKRAARDPQTATAGTPAQGKATTERNESSPLDTASARPTISVNGRHSSKPRSGTWLGRFRNTFYNFPLEADYSGETTALYDRHCQPVASVPVAFHDRLCVQGSGRLSRGQTVSYARRNCRCARVCPRTNQQICFEALSRKRFPWGRGAAGTAIVPLQTIAVDSDVIALGTVVYIPQFAGQPTALDGTGSHTGCFVAADRGSGVRGKHIDVFAGSEALTRQLNQLVPSNRGVDVFIDSPQCETAFPAR